MAKPKASPAKSKAPKGRTATRASAKPAAKKMVAAAARPKPPAVAAPPRKVLPIPSGHHSVTPYLTIRGVAAAIEFYHRAFAAIERVRMPMPNGTTIMHAEIQIGDSHIYMSDEMPEMGGDCKSPQSLGGTSCTIHLYVQDVDAVFNRAVASGATPLMPPADMFWGDRFAKVADPFGHHWSIATHKEDLTPEEMGRRAEKAFADFKQVK
jgi:uncharacterized glyoxalase superfamily protein PhnB